MPKVLVRYYSSYGHIEAMARLPSEIDLEGARHQGELVARTAAKLFG